MSPTLSWLLAAGAALPVASPATPQAQPYRFHFDHVLGTSLDLVAVAPDEATALMAVTAARREIARLDAILSDWRGDSQLAALNRQGAGTAAPELIQVLQRCEHWRVATDGAFDCRAGGPLQAWRDAADRSVPLDEVRLDKALVQAAQPPRLNKASVSLPAGMRLTVDGLAKGYVIDAALAAARRASPNLHGLMVDVGGDLRCWGRSPTPGGWRVGVADALSPDNAAPAQVLRLDDRALATSARGARDLSVQGCVVSHTLDPASGRPVSAVRSAAVVARSAADADALATAFMVMPPQRALALADRLEGVEAFITDSDGARHLSRGWGDLASGEARLQRASYVGAAAPAQAAGLDLTYTVPKIDADPYHAPYVVAWITDGNRKLVQTLMILGAKPKWAPENFIWWRRYGRIAPQVLDTVGRATRPPGRYAIHWDGKDDKGAPAAPGAYILHIEASREKGGHTYQTVDFTLGAASTKALPAKDEMGPMELKIGPAA